MPLTTQDLATGIWFGKIKNIEDIIASGYEFRKGKKISDVNHALEKARKNGMQKTEFELNMLEVYLKNLLKVKKVK